jgi:hypothetical protein
MQYYWNSPDAGSEEHRAKAWKCHFSMFENLFGYARKKND